MKKLHDRTKRNNVIIRRVPARSIRLNCLILKYLNLPQNFTTWTWKPVKHRSVEQASKFSLSGISPASTSKLVYILPTVNFYTVVLLYTQESYHLWRQTTPPSEGPVLPQVLPLATRDPPCGGIFPNYSPHRGNAFKSTG